jgi:ABC-type multidrug transport system permease subunit
MSRIIAIFFRDLKVASRDAMTIYIGVVPILLAILINFFAPGLNDTTVNLAMLSDDSESHIEYMEQFANVELFESEEEIDERISKQDDIVGMVPNGGNYDIIVQGNEAGYVEDYAVMLNSLYELGAEQENTTAEMFSFGNSVPPLKTKLVNMLILMIIMLTGMLIAIGIVDEKVDNTINAVNVSPTSKLQFVFGKSILGASVALIGIILAIIICGYSDINWGMILLVGISSMLITLAVGFLQGLNSKDVMDAAAGVKMIMLPIAGSIAVYELLGPEWQWIAYWSPFYWAYKANDMILSGTATWGAVLFSVAIILGITVFIYFISIPRIRKGLS